MIKSLLMIAVLLGMSSVLRGQNCEEILQYAKMELDRGHFVIIPKMLSGCLRNGFTKEQNARAYQILTHVNVLLGNTEEAEANYLNLLRANPTFFPTIQNNEIDLVYLSRKFTTTAIIEPYIRGAVSTAYPFYYDNINLNPYFQDFERKINIGGEIGGGVSWNWSDQWALGSELNLAYRVIKTRFTFISGSDEMKVSEGMFWIDSPIFLKYTFPMKKNVPYLFAGVQANFLLLGNSLIEGLYNVKEDANGTPFKSSTINITKSRNRVNASLLGGLGVKFRQGQGYWFVDGRASLGVTQVVNKGGDYYDNDAPDVLSKNVTRFRWASAFYSINYLSASVGYIFPCSQPRRIKRSFLSRLGLKKRYR